MMKKAAILAAIAMIAQLVILPGMALASTVAPLAWGPVAEGAGLGIADNTKGNQKLGWGDDNRLASTKVVIPAEGEAVAPAEGEEVAPAEEVVAVKKMTPEERQAYFETVWLPNILKVNGFGD